MRGDAMGNDERFRVLWVTNYAAPYRRPVWRAIGAQTELDVVTLESDEQLRRERRRGGDWAVGDGTETTYSLQSARTCVVGRGERKLYVALGRIRPPGRPPRATLIGGWESPAYWQALVNAKLSRTRTVGFYESTLATQHHTLGAIAWARRRFFRSLDAVVVPGTAARDAVVHMGVRSDRVHIGFNAIDVDMFRRLASSEDIEPRSGHRYVYVGQLIERKNLQSLLDAFAGIRQVGDTLTIVGEGELDATLREHARASDIHESVRFVGAVPYADLPGVLWQHETLVLPSEEEVWGLVVNEALAAGLHVVVSESAGVAPSVADMRGAFVVDTSPEAIARGLQQSRNTWTGPIAEPAVLAFTPERFAGVFLDALLGNSPKTTYV